MVMYFLKYFIGIRIFSKSITDKIENGLGYKRDKIDIYSNSWGPSDNGRSVIGPGLKGKRALKQGALEVRSMLA